MSVLLDSAFLSDIGVTLSESDRGAFSQYYESVLSERVINEIIRELENEQLEELHKYRNRGEAELWQWLKENVPQLGEIVQDEVAILLGGIAEK